MLKLNDSKTEVVVFSPPNIPPPLMLSAFHIVDLNITPLGDVRDLGFRLEKHLNAEAQVNALCSAAYHHLANISAMRVYLSNASAEKLVHAFVTTKLDFCNALYAFLPKHLVKELQRIQYAAARIVTRTPKREHMTPILKQLHWLPVPKRIDFKLACITWQCVHGSAAPAYLKEMCKSYEPSRSLRSASAYRLQVPVARTNIGRRAFSYAGPHVWNSLPLQLIQCQSYPVFKKNFKNIFIFTKFLICSSNVFLFCEIFVFLIFAH